MKRSAEFDKLLINVLNTCKSMSSACVELNLQYGTLKRHAQRLGVWKPNQGGRGFSKVKSSGFFTLEDVLQGKHPQYQRKGLKKKLYKSGLKEKRCEVCGITEWNGKEIVFELEHIDGNTHNHVLDNLMIICPNCHSQTSTFRGKNIKARVVKLGRHISLKN